MTRMAGKGIDASKSSSRRNNVTNGRSAGRILSTFAKTVTALVWEAFRYAALTVGDLIGEARVLLLSRRRTRSTALAEKDEFNRVIDALRARRTARWQRWGTLPAGRRWQIRLMVATLCAAAILFLRATPHAPVPRFTGLDTAGTSSRKTPQRTRPPMPTSTSTPADFLAARQMQHAGQWLPFAGNPVLTRGELDEWDGFKVGSPIVIKESTSRYRMWYRGCHFVTGEYSCAVGHASSDDGVIWRKGSEPVFRPDNLADSERLGGFSIVRVGDRYFMWYAVTADWFADPPRRYATINLATSPDGLHWQNAGEVLRTVRSSMVDVEPASFFDGALFHLWFTDLSTTDQQKVLIHEISSDGKQWAWLARRQSRRFEWSWAGSVSSLMVVVDTLRW